MRGLDNERSGSGDGLLACLLVKVEETEGGGSESLYVILDAQVS